MEVVEASIVLLPRFTTLVGRFSAGQHFDFTTLPLDVSRFSGAQFQFWRAPGSGTLSVFLEESLDSATWALGPFSPSAITVPADETVFFSYNFLLRWFRLRVRITGVSTPVITCWAEGLLRGGGSGAWPGAEGPPAGDRGLVAAGAMPAGGGGPKGARPDPEMRRLQGGKGGPKRRPAAPGDPAPSGDGGGFQTMDPSAGQDARGQALQELLQRQAGGDAEAFARLVAQTTKK